MPILGDIPNRNVGPTVLRRLFRQPQGRSSDETVALPDWAGRPVRIPNRNVGPPALRQTFRAPFARPVVVPAATPIVAGAGLWIAGTEVTALGYLMANSVTIKSTAYAQNGTMSFRLECAAGAYTPAAESVVVYAPSYPTIAFRGYIRNLRRSNEARVGRTIFEIDCQDTTSLLNDDIVIGPYGARAVAETDKQRLAWLLGQWGTKGITVGANVQVLVASMPADDYTGKTLAEAVTMVLAVSGANYYVDTSLALHTFLTETNVAPFGLSDAPDGVTTFGYRDFELPDETTALKNGVWVNGGPGTSPTLYTDTASIAALAAITGGNGQRFATIKDTSLTTQAAMDAAGAAFLLTNSSAVKKGSLVTFTAGLTAGMTVAITNADHGIAAVTYRISEITTTWPNNLATYKVSFGNIAPPSLATTIGGITAKSPALTAAMADALGGQQALDFAAGIVRPGIVTTLPTLPNPSYPIGWLVVLTTDGKLYRNVAGSWSAAVDGADIIANTITAGQVGAGGISAGVITGTEISALDLYASQLTLRDTSGQTALDASGFGPLWRRFIDSGLYNSDFTGLPPSPGNDITQASAVVPNVLPFWSLRFDPTTTAVSARSVADSTAPSGRVIRFTSALTPSGAQSNAIIQDVRIAADRATSVIHSAIASFRTPAAVPATTVMYVRTYYLTAAGLTTGTAGLTQIIMANVGTNATREVRAYPNAGVLPIDAFSLRVEVGMFRQSGSEAGTLDLCDVAVGRTYSNFPQATGLAPVRLATVAALPTNTVTADLMTASATGALANIDGTAAAVGDRVLVKNETTIANNGIYTVTTLGQSASAGIAEVTAQRGTNENGGATTIDLTYPSTPTSGDLLVAVLGWRGDATISTVPTGWALAASGGNGSGIDSAIYWKIATASESKLHTWGLSSSVKAAVVAGEWSNGTGWLAAPVDKTNSNTSTGTAGTTGLTGVLTQAAELVVTGFASIDTDTWSSFDNSQTEVGEITSTGGPPSGRNDVAMGSRIVAATTSVNYGATLSSSQIWSSAVATFMPAAPSGTATAWTMTRTLDWNGDFTGTGYGPAGSRVSVYAGTHNIGTDWVVDTARTTWYQVGDRAGMMKPYGAAAAPAGWLLCDGTSYLRTDYPALFTAIGTTYGSADGTHFNVPNLVDKIVVGGTPGVGAGTVSPAAALTSHAALATHQHRLPFDETGGGNIFFGNTYGSVASAVTADRQVTGAASSSTVSAMLSQAVSGGTPDAHAIFKNTLVAWIIKI